MNHGKFTPSRSYGVLRKFHKTAVAAAIGISLGSGAQAVANNWLGNTSQPFSPGNWSLGAPQDGGTAGAVFINGAGVAPLWGDSAGSPGFDVWFQKNEMLVGSGGRADASFRVVSTDEAPLQKFEITDGADSSLNLSPAALPLFRVGDAGGKGVLHIDLTGRTSSNRGGGLTIDAGGLGVGTGAGSNGLLNIIGKGKGTDAFSSLPYNSISFGFAVGSVFRNMRIGDVGGSGVLNVDGAGVHLADDSGNYRDSNTLASVLSNGKVAIGLGQGSNGQVNVLNGGKLAISVANSSDSVDMSGTNLSSIGRNMGVGRLTVHAPGGNGGLPNRLHVAYGMNVGVDGGQGQLDVLAGGKGWIHKGPIEISSSSADSCVSASYYSSKIAPLVVGDISNTPNLSTRGWARANGAGAQLLVTGNSSDSASNISKPISVRPGMIGRIQVNEGGALVAGNGGTVQVGAAVAGARYDSGGSGQQDTVIVSRLGPVDVTGNGGVYYGSEATAQPVGSVEASQISLQSSQAQVVFNHTESNFQFGMPVVGSGKLVQRAGTTAIAPSYIAPAPSPDGTTWAYDSDCATPTISHPLNQQGFSGSVVVEGGALVLPVDQPLNSAVALAISGGVLQQQGTKQAFGAVTMAGGQLQLSGNSGAADTTTAASWAGGGGVVSVDTILNDGTSNGTSDKVKITGRVTGTTKLKINNLRGAGAQTVGNGILIVETAGSPADAFVLDGGPITQGGYIYKLVQVGSNWYLQSQPVAPATGRITVTAAVTAPADAPFSGSIPYTLTCTAPDYNSSGTITVTNNVGTPVPITVARGSQCKLGGRIQSMPTVPGYTWGTPVYVQPSEAMPDGGIQPLSMSIALTKNGRGTGGAGGGTAKITPVPALGAGGLASLAGLLGVGAALVRRRKADRRVW